MSALRDIASQLRIYAGMLEALDAAQPVPNAPDPAPSPPAPVPQPAPAPVADITYAWDWNTVPKVIDTYPQMTQRGPLVIAVTFTPDRQGRGDIAVVEYPGDQANVSRTVSLVRLRDGAVIVERTGSPVTLFYQVSAGMPVDLYAPLELGVEYAYVLRSAGASDVRITCHRPQ